MRDRAVSVVSGHVLGPISLLVTPVYDGRLRGAYEPCSRKRNASVLTAAYDGYRKRLAARPLGEETASPPTAYAAYVNSASAKSTPAHGAPTRLRATSLVPLRAAAESVAERH